MTHKDNANWISELAGRDVAPPKREKLQDLIDSRPFWLSLADLTDLPENVKVHEGLTLWERGETTLTADVYVPAGPGPVPLFMHSHGGGYCTGSVMNDRKIGMKFAERGYVVVNTEYSLSPENPFPRAVEDCLYAIRWLVTHAAEFKGDPTRVVVEGGSAGAGLSSAVILALAGEGGPLDEGDLAGVPVPIKAAILWYGMFSFPELLLSPGSNVGPAELWTRAYLGPHFTTKLRHPLVSAVFSEKLAAYPPVFLSCGSEDSMLGHTLAMVRALADAGVDMTASIPAGLDHSFVKFAGSNPAAGAEVDRAHAWLAGKL